MLRDTHIDVLAERPIDPVATLTDEQLKAAGLTKIQVFVRNESGKAAQRAVRHKEKLATAGLRQLNVIVPDEARVMIKAIAARTADGEALPAVLADLVASTTSVKNGPTTAQLIELEQLRDHVTQHSAVVERLHAKNADLADQLERTQEAVVNRPVF